MSKAPKQLSICLRKQASSLLFFYYVLCEGRAYKLISINGVTVSYRRSTRIRYQKAISWSVIKYSKKCSGQCNVTAQIEQVQDKKKH